MERPALVFPIWRTRQPRGGLNTQDVQGIYKAMNRAETMTLFNRDVVGKLRSSTNQPVNISHVFFYDYDSGGKSPKCDRIGYSCQASLSGWCIDGVIDPSSGDLVPGMAAAVSRTVSANRPQRAPIFLMIFALHAPCRSRGLPHISVGMSFSHAACGYFVAACFMWPRAAATLMAHAAIAKDRHAIVANIHWTAMAVGFWIGQ
jgi:hypothetical protein